MEPSSRSGGRRPRPARARAVRSLLVPLVVGLPPLFWVVDATQRASLTPLGRDQGIFQYIAWVIGRGAVDYRDVRDVNGPLTHLVHMALLALGGKDEHRFRVLDLAVTGVTFAVAGACLPGLRSRRAPSILERAAWALAGWVVLSGQYLLYDYWHTAQRESFFDWFLLPSLSLQLVALAPWFGGAAGAGRRKRFALLGVVGALSVVPWFGKPTYVLFTLVQLLAIAARAPRAGRIPPRLVRRRLARTLLAAFAVGGAHRRGEPSRVLARPRRRAGLRANPAGRRPCHVPFHLASGDGRPLVRSVAGDAGGVRGRRCGGPARAPGVG